ncbi:hypothetical protein J2W42_003265 [Rhizobium tibeticum]|nr:hypothetical protein [Rhizobium tibeticum]
MEPRPFDCAKPVTVTPEAPLALYTFPLNNVRLSGLATVASRI